jgi:WD40 repeat protein/energy-coupling factor transporter ATP-binding protein EcfA2
MSEKTIDIKQEKITSVFPDEILYNPFPGLRPFGVEESHLFFGREGQSDEVLMKLAKNRFIAVLGASGSGKSSLMYCGVIPILYGGFMAQAGSNWKIIVTRPGSGPIDNLAESLLVKDRNYAHADEEGKKIRRTITSTVLRSSSLGLIESVQQLKKDKNENVLLLVDQFEELFRYKKNEEGSTNESLAFVNLLLEAARQQHTGIYVCLTMRSDFIGDCAQFPELTKFINDSNYLIPQMNREQKRLAIIGPVAVGGGHISPRLVQQLMNDLGDNPDQLPILQHSLMRTWNYWTEQRETGEAIDLRHYDAIGRMAEALSQHANEAYDELDDHQKKICESLFKSLTEKGNNDYGIRRPTRLGVIAAIAGVKIEEVIPVVDCFRAKGRSLIMPPSGVPLTATTVVDISHESLMRIWARLKNWVEEESESVAMYQRLSEAASMYQLGKTSLWRPPDLQLGINWRTKQNPTLVWGQRYNPAFERTVLFLDYSQKEFETEQRNKELLQKRQLKRARVTALILGTAAIISIFFLLFAVVARNEAISAKAKAEENMQLAMTNEKKAKEAEEVAKHEKMLADEAKLAAIKEKEEADKQRKKAEEQTKIAETQRKRAEEQTKIAVAQTKLAEEQTQLALTNEKEANKQKALADENSQKAYRLRLLSIAQSMAVKSVPLSDTARKALLAKHAYLLNKNNGGNEYSHEIYDALYYSLKLLKDENYNSMKGHTDAVRSLVFSSSGSELYTSGSDGKVILWDMKTPERKSTVIAENKYIIRTLALSADNKYLACGGDSRTIKVYDLTNPAEKPRELKGHKGNVWSMVFTPDNSSLISTATDSMVFLWKQGSDTPEIITKNTCRIRTLSVSPDGLSIAGGTEKGQVILWSLLNNSSEALFTTKKNKIVNSVSFSNDGKLIAVGDDAGVLRIWDVSQRKIVNVLTSHKARINDVKFSKDDHFLSSASFDGSIKVWNMRKLNDQPVVLKDHSSWVWKIAYSPEGDKLVAGCVDNLIRVWPTNADVMAEQICSRIKRNMSLKEWEQYVAPVNDIPYESTCPDLPVGTEVNNE